MRSYGAAVIRLAAALLSTALLGCASAGPFDAYLPPLPALAAEPVANDVAWLAAPEREGRGLGTRGLSDAARYIADAFQAAGLEPGGDDGGFLQRLRVPVSLEVAEAELALGARAFARGTDFDALPASSSAALPSEWVFAGFGISDPETGWDDYAGIDVEGKTVLVFDGRPGEAVPAGASGEMETSQPSPLGGARGAGFARASYKLLNARGHGAAAILIAVGHPTVPGLPGLAGPASANPTLRDAGVVALSLDYATAAALVAAAGVDLAALRAEVERGQPASRALTRVALTGRVRIERREGQVANVVGLRRGTDPERANEAVVIGAHYDHLGFGSFGSLAPDRRGEVHAGADDNASGTAALLALARAFGSEPATPRSLVLVAFTAEEAGLLGSQHYAEHPALPLDASAAMLNLDMVGRLRSGKLVVFGAESAPGLREVVAAASRDLALEPAFEAGAVGPSDHTSFAARGVPVLSFFTGLHAQYHTPDDLPGRVDASGAARVAALAYRVAGALLAADGRPRFAGPVSPHGAGAPAAGAPGYGPYLGTVPAFGADAVVGVRLSGVRPDSPAARAGLRAGDVIVGFGGAEVRDLTEFAALLFTQSPGSRVEITLEREGERITTEATLGQRR